MSRPSVSRLNGATCVVTGAAGFLGSHLCDRLLGLGVFVTGVDSFATSDGSNIDHLSDDDRFSFVLADLQEEMPDVPGTAFVAHLASPASPPDYLDQPIATLRTGSIGTENALRNALGHGARFVLASTSEVYGDPLVHPQGEDYWGNVNPVGPRSVYDEAKRYAEAVTMAYHRTHQLDVGIVRIFNTYGPRMRVGDGRAIPEFFAAALADKPLPVFGDGSQTRSLCYVSDLVDGLVRMLVSEAVGPVNLGNPNEVSIAVLADKVQETVGRRPGVTLHPLPTDDPVRRRPDITLAQRVLDWKPKVGLEEGLERTASWYESQVQSGTR